MKAGAPGPTVADVGRAKRIAGQTTTGAALLLLLVAVGCSGPGVELEFRAGHAFSARERQTIRDIAERAVADARRHLPALPSHLRITVQAGSHVIPETGETGGVGLPAAVYWTVDPAHDGGVIGVANAQLRATLLHEWYHLVREAKLPTESLVDRAVPYWMYRHPDGRRWIGYKVGTRLADRARQRSGLSLAQLAAVPTHQIVAWGTGRGRGQ